MATKKETEAKKRKGATAAAKGGGAAEGQVLGTVSIPVQASISVSPASVYNELVIEWGCLGLSEEPDAIAETSGNARMLDPKRAPRTDEEGLHVFFDPPLGGGAYGFQFLFTYNDAVEAKTHNAPTDEERAKEEKPAAEAA